MVTYVNRNNMLIEPKTILVYVGLDRIGDSLLKLPFVRELRLDEDILGDLKKKKSMIGDIVLNMAVFLFNWF